MGAGTGWGWRQAAGGGKGPVTGQAELRFGGLLRRLRDDAGLTQDELAEAAQVSQRAISDLERGINATARTDTARLLAGALGLDGPARELFMRPRGAARRRVRRWQPRRGSPGREGRRRPAGRCRGTSPASPAGRPSSAS